MRMLPRCLLVVAIPLTSSARGADAGNLPAEAGMNAKSEALVAEVASGKRAVANAAWWGFDGKDSTEALQAAIRSGARTLFVPDLGRPWIVARTIALASDQEIVLLPGVVVEAMRGRFRGRGDALLAAADRKNLVLRGPGATLRMHKADYHKPPYEKAEWRHALSIRGCTGVEVVGLTLRDSGGDGVYIGSTSKQDCCKDVVLRGLTCDGNNRQGLSVISAENLLVEDCRFLNTAGTAPQAGIDLEPNRPGERLVQCVIRNCHVEGNAGPGMYLYLRHLDRKSRDLSVLFDRCTVKGCGRFGIGGGRVKEDGPGGSIEFRDVVVEDTDSAGCYVYDMAPGRARMRFVRCTFKHTARKHGSPVVLALRDPEMVGTFGGVELADCVVEDDQDRPLLTAAIKSPGRGPVDVAGKITYRGPGAPRVELGARGAEVNLEVVPAP